MAELYVTSGRLVRVRAHSAVTILTHSAAANIRLGAPGAGDEAVQAACKLSGAHDFIVALPQGHETMIGDFSAKLSGGEIQRLALVVNSPALILDECTSSFDAETEGEVLNRVLAAAVRYLSYRRADRIGVVPAALPGP